MPHPLSCACVGWLRCVLLGCIAIVTAGAAVRRLGPEDDLPAALATLGPGDTVELADGVYALTRTLVLDRSGTADAPIRLEAAPGARPILCFSAWQPTEEKTRVLARGLFLSGDHWRLTGLEVRHAPDNGLKIEGSQNRVERCVFHHNGDSGVQIGLWKKAVNDGTRAAGNVVRDCDSYRNFDAGTRGENADGFACKLSPGPGNRFEGCRAWENADDGWDLYMASEPVTLVRCWAWHNGDAALFPRQSSYAGDGNGFKLGGADHPARHVVERCVAFDHPFGSGNGFEDNNNPAPITLRHCVAWGNRTNYEFKKAAHVLENCVAFSPVSARQDVDFDPRVVSRGSTWRPDPKKPAKYISTARPDDLQSLDVALAAAPRGVDGALPVNAFARPRPGSSLVDVGVDLGAPYHGVAPDAGAFELGDESESQPIRGTGASPDRVRR